MCLLNTYVYFFNIFLPFFYFLETKCFFFGVLCLFVLCDVRLGQSGVEFLVQFDDDMSDPIWVESGRVSLHSPALSEV